VRRCYQSRLSCTPVRFLPPKWRSRAGSSKARSAAAFPNAVAPSVSRVWGRWADLAPVDARAATGNMLIELLRRGFDLVCMIAGVAALCLLGPPLLWSAGTLEIPEVRQLTRLDGRLRACEETFSASVLLLDDRDTRLESQAGSCTQPLDRDASVTVFVLPADAKAAKSGRYISSYGLSVNGNVVREPAADIEATRIDRAFRLCLGLLGTAALLAPLLSIGRARGTALRRYFYTVLTAVKIPSGE